MEQTQSQKKHSITIYSTSTCMYCKMAKEFFEENKIEFIDHNVQENIAMREEMIKKSGQQGVPVIDIDGQLTVGFDKARIKQLLGM